MAYNKTVWINGTAPPINAENLNKIEQGIEDAHAVVPAVDGTTGQVLTKTASGTEWSDAGNPTDEQVAEAVTDWLDENITEIPATAPIVDSSLTVQGAAADAKKTGDEILDLKSQIGDTSELETEATDLVSAINEVKNEGAGGLTDDIKQALVSFATSVLQLANHVGFVGDDPTGQTYITAISNAEDDLYDALYPPAILVSISAVYVQSGVVKDGASLDTLRSDLTVTAHYDDSTSAEVNDYTLSGTLREGTSVITVTYEDKTTTFNVIVSSSKFMYANWDLTDSLIDSVNGYEFTITTASGGGTIQQVAGTGVVFTASSSGGMKGDLTCAQAFPLGATVEFELDTTPNMAKNSGDKGSTYGYGNGRLAKLSGITVMQWRGISDKFYAYYSSAWKDIYTITDPDYFDGKTVKLVTDENGAVTVYADDVQVAKTANSLLTAENGVKVAFGYGTSQASTFANMTIKSVRVYTEE